MPIVLGPGISPLNVHKLSLLKLPAWGLLPEFALPSSGIDLIVGKSITIYGDTLINVPIVNDLTVDYVCAIGTQSGNNFTLNPVNGDIGVHTLIITFRNKGLLITEQTVNLNIIAVESRAVKVMMLGDSLVYLGNLENATAINTLLPLVTFVGRQGTTIKHEGKGGYSYERFATDIGSPFIKAGSLNIPAYFIDNSVPTPDYIMIRLGVNACYGASDNRISASTITTIINNEISYAKVLIAAFLAYDSAIRVIIALPTISENTGAGWNSDYDESIFIQDKYIELIHRLWQTLLTNFDSDAYNKNVTISNEAVLLDRNDGYTKTLGVHNNGLHPASSGYTQLGTGMALTLNKTIKTIPTALTLSLISGGVKIDWTDNSAGAFETEIWGKNDNDVYALLYTIAAGIATKSETVLAVDLRYYKIRGKNGTYFTPFTPEVSIAMLGGELVVNGNFAAWTGDNPDGWTVAEGGNNYITEVSGKCRLFAIDTGLIIQQTILTNALTYRFKINITAVDAGSIRLKYTAINNTVIGTTGLKVIYGVTDGDTLAITRYSGATDVTFDDVSAKIVLMP